MVQIKDEHKDLALVPESVLKKRHDLDDLRRKKAAKESESNKNNSARKSKGTYVRKPATFLAKAKQRRHEQIRYRRVKKKGMQKKASKKTETREKEITIVNDDETSDSEETTRLIKYTANSVGSPYVFVIRIREDAGHPPRCVLNILLQLRLKEANTGVFVKYTETTKRHLHLVEPWVVYGKPSDGLVGDLMERKSFGVIRGENVPLSDNTIIENALGNEHGMICMEDLVHELTSVGKPSTPLLPFCGPFPCRRPEAGSKRTSCR